jgi:hypothetical protein
MNETSFFLPLHHAAQIYYLKHTLSNASALTISSVLHEFQLSESGLDSPPQMYAPH